eukprot:jgi/Botrbrau1/5042/Bobra.37_1s0008.1
MVSFLYPKTPFVRQRGPLEALSLNFKRDNQKTHTLILDLDQTLIHSRVIYTVNGEEQVENDEPNPRICPNLDVLLDLDELKRYEELDPSISAMKVQLWYRPGLEQFMQCAAELFEIVIFSAGKHAYVHAVVERIPNNTCIKSVFTAKHTEVFSNGGNMHEEYVVKDISGIFDGEQPRLPATVIIVDDKVENFCNHLDNVVPIIPFTGNDPSDKELEWLLSVLQDLKDAADVCVELRKKFNLRERLEEVAKNKKCVKMN